MKVCTFVLLFLHNILSCLIVWKHIQDQKISGVHFADTISVRNGCFAMFMRSLCSAAFGMARGVGLHSVVLLMS